MEYDGLVAGLGNPGARYAGTRHNCGFMFVDQLLGLAEKDGSVTELNGKKFNALLWRVKSPEFEGEWLVAKPLTFMNDSGNSIKPLLAWHNIKPERLIVAQDELDLPPGELRFKFGGGLAGHNGLLSISQKLGTQNYYRLRVGIGKPPSKDEILSWVLGRPAPEERPKMENAIGRAVETFQIFTEDGFEPARLFARTGHE